MAAGFMGLMFGRLILEQMGGVVVAGLEPILL
jgi:hypothetical protein